jgi:hypothetical protein
LGKRCRDFDYDEVVGIVEASSTGAVLRNQPIGSDYDQNNIPAANIRCELAPKWSAYVHEDIFLPERLGDPIM